MAFGDLLGSLTVNAASVTNPFAAVGSVVVAVGDLVVAVFAEQTGITVTGVTDNLGNTYSAQNAGSVGGTATGRAFYSRVTVAGTLTSVSGACTASSHNAVFNAAVYAGPFATSPLDASPANLTSSADASPYDCPATGTLAQASELVVAWCARNNAVACTPTAPMSNDIEATNSPMGCTIGHYVVSSTTTTAPQWTSSGSPATVLGTMSFKQAAGAAFTWQDLISDDNFGLLRFRSEIVGY